ncbi:hypothetical protein QTP86_022633 [Hemibagrus guttatus]|nr:hypothetical protein QTP86_022633 [Hemibagrus guttatus]
MFIKQLATLLQACTASSASDQRLSDPFESL